MSVSTIKNYLQISNRIASSGQPNEGQLKEIQKAGYQLVINLAMSDSGNAIAEEENIVTSSGMDYVHIPVPFNAPTADHLKQFIHTMQAASEQKVWIHCMLNYRVSAFLYQYQRLVHGASDEEAKNAMLKSWQPDAVWQEFMSLSRQDIGL